MKLVRIGKLGEERPGVFLNGEYYNASSVVEDYNEAFWAEEDNIEELRKAFENDLMEPITPERLEAPIAKPGKIICIGLNYRKHAIESGMDIPKEPIIFFKATSAIVGPNDSIVIPKNSFKADWEVEMAVVIGKKASYVNEEDAMNHVAGYLIHNDVSEREFQLERGGQWVKGKSSDTFAPLGQDDTWSQRMKLAIRIILDYG